VNSEDAPPTRWTPFQILPQPPLTSTAATPPVTSNSDDLVNEVTANVRVDEYRPHTNACFAGNTACLT
jgi:hypothetical protein